MEYKRRNAKHDGIYEVLKEFQVHPDFNHGQGGGYLEIIGSKTNIQLAEYISHFLDHSIDRVWNEARAENPRLKGAVAKNSFIRSFCHEVAKGLQVTSASNEIAQSKEIIAIKNDLQVKVERVYPRLRASYSKAKNDRNASNIGSSKGKKFKISPAIKNKGNSSKLLSFFK
jgi:hypothetical protein